MKNLFISIIIFFSMCTLIFVCEKHFDNSCKELDDLSSTIEILVENNEWETAFLYSINLLDMWEEETHIISLFVNDVEIDTITDEIVRSSQYIKLKNLDESIANLHLVKYRIEHIKNSQRLTFENLF